MGSWCQSLEAVLSMHTRVCECGVCACVCVCMEKGAIAGKEMTGRWLCGCGYGSTVEFQGETSATN